MATARSAWGIDIGNRALKAIKLVRGDNGLVIDDFEVIEHETVLSNAGDNKEALIQAAMSTFVQRHGGKGEIAGVSVSGVSSFARFIKLPPVEPKKIPEIVKFEAIQQIPFPLADVEWAYQLFQTPESPDVEVGIFAMRQDLINHHLQYFTDVNINVQVVQMNPLAVYNAMYHDDRIKGTTMMIDLGAENTDLIIADSETVWLRSIPIGGNNFTEVLVKSFKLPFNKAEELKRNANTSKYARQIFQAMRPVFADLVAEIQRSIGFYSSVHRDSRIDRIIAVGGTFRLSGLQKYLQQNLQVEVQKVNELVGGAPTDAKLAATFNENLLSLVGAYGLAIQAMGEAKIHSSLLPRQIRRARMWRDKTKWFATAAAVCLIGTGVTFGGYYARQVAYDRAKDTRATNDEILQTASALAASWTSSVEGAGADDRQRISNLRGMLDERTTWIKIINNMFAALPPIPPEFTAGNADQIKATPRTDRKIILIDSVTSQYVPDLGTMVAGRADLLTAFGVPAPAAPAAGAAPTPPTDPNLPPGLHGYLVTISVTTPHSDGFLFVLNTFCNQLKKFNQDAMIAWNTAHPKDPQNFYFAEVSAPIAQMQLSQDTARRPSFDQSYAAVNQVLNRVAAAPAPLVPGGPVVVPSLVDRITGEDMSNDWDMKVAIAVVVDPPPKAPAAPTTPAAPQ